MAEPQSLSQRIGLTGGKAALIGALAVALVGVLYWQYSGSEGDAAIAVVDSMPPPVLPNAAPAMPEPPAVAAALIPVEVKKPESPTAVAAAFDETKWKSPDLAKVVAYDPFAVPDTFPQPVRAAVDLQSLAAAEETDAQEAAARLAEAVEKLQSELKALQERGVHVIMRTGKDQYVALIGNRTIRVGDEIDGGFTVTAIEPDGVRVERKLNP